MAKYQNYKANLSVLKRAPEQDLTNEFVQSGIIDKFVMQFELSWKLLKEALEYEGIVHASTGSPRMVIKASYTTYEFIDEELWLNMLTDRNRSEHVYDSTLAKRLVNTILDSYIGVFEKLLEELENMYGEDLLETF